MRCTKTQETAVESEVRSNYIQLGLKNDRDIRPKNLKVIQIFKSTIRYKCSKNLKCFHIKTLTNVFPKHAVTESTETKILDLSLKICLL